MVGCDIVMLMSCLAILLHSNSHWILVMSLIASCVSGFNTMVSLKRLNSSG
jgi:hypothetical protein